jgi:hypothetical protein
MDDRIDDSFEKSCDVEVEEFNAQGKSGSKTCSPTKKKWRNS